MCVFGCGGLHVCDQRVPAARQLAGGCACACLGVEGFTSAISACRLHGNWQQVGVGVHVRLCACACLGVEGFTTATGSRCMCVDVRVYAWMCVYVCGCVCAGACMGVRVWVPA